MNHLSLRRELGIIREKRRVSKHFYLFQSLCVYIGSVTKLLAEEIEQKS